MFDGAFLDALQKASPAITREQAAQMMNMELANIGVIYATGMIKTMITEGEGEGTYTSVLGKELGIEEGNIEQARAFLEHWSKETGQNLMGICGNLGAAHVKAEDQAGVKLQNEMLEANLLLAYTGGAGDMAFQQTVTGPIYIREDGKRTDRVFDPKTASKEFAEAFKGAEEVSASVDKECNITWKIQKADGVQTIVNIWEIKTAEGASLDFVKDVRASVTTGSMDSHGNFVVDSYDRVGNAWSGWDTTKDVTVRLLDKTVNGLMKAGQMINTGYQYTAMWTNNIAEQTVWRVVVPIYTFAIDLVYGGFSGVSAGDKYVYKPKMIYSPDEFKKTVQGGLNDLAAAAKGVGWQGGLAKTVLLISVVQNAVAEGLLFMPTMGLDYKSAYESGWISEGMATAITWTVIALTLLTPLGGAKALAKIPGFGWAKSAWAATTGAIGKAGEALPGFAKSIAVNTIGRLGSFGEGFTKGLVGKMSPKLLAKTSLLGRTGYRFGRAISSPGSAVILRAANRLPGVTKTTSVFKAAFRLARVGKPLPKVALGIFRPLVGIGHRAGQFIRGISAGVQGAIALKTAPGFLKLGNLIGRGARFIGNIGSVIAVPFKAIGRGIAMPFKAMGEFAKGISAGARGAIALPSASLSFQAGNAFVRGISAGAQGAIALKTAPGFLKLGNLIGRGARFIGNIGSVIAVPFKAMGEFARGISAGAQGAIALKTMSGSFKAGNLIGRGARLIGIHKVPAVLEAGVGMGRGWGAAYGAVYILTGLVQYGIALKEGAQIRDKGTGTMRPVRLGDFFNIKELRREVVKGFVHGMAFGMAGKTLGFVAESFQNSRFLLGFRAGYAPGGKLAEGGSVIVHWFGRAANTFHSSSAVARTAVFMAAGATWNVYRDIGKGDIRITEDGKILWGDVLVSAVSGAVIGAVFAYASSARGLEHMANARNLFVEFGKDTAAMVDASLAGAADWMIVDPAFTIFGAVWEGGFEYLAAVVNGDEHAKFDLMVTDRHTGQRSALLSWEGSKVLMKGIAEAPLTGLWMGPTVKMFGLQLEANIIGEGSKGLMVVLGQSPGLITKVVNAVRYMFVKGETEIAAFHVGLANRMASAGWMAKAFYKMEGLAYIAGLVAGIDKGLSLISKDAMAGRRVGLGELTKSMLAWVFLFMKPTYGYKKGTGGLLHETANRFKNVDTARSREVIREIESLVVECEKLGGGKNGLAVVGDRAAAALERVITQKHDKARADRVKEQKETGTKIETRQAEVEVLDGRADFLKKHAERLDKQGFHDVADGLRKQETSIRGKADKLRGEIKELEGKLLTAEERAVVELRQQAAELRDPAVVKQKIEKEVMDKSEEADKADAEADKLENDAAFLTKSAKSRPAAAKDLKDLAAKKRQEADGLRQKARDLRVEAGKMLLDMQQRLDEAPGKAGELEAKANKLEAGQLESRRADIKAELLSEKGLTDAESDIVNVYSIVHNARQRYIATSPAEFSEEQIREIGEATGAEVAIKGFGQMRQRVAPLRDILWERGRNSLSHGELIELLAKEDKVSIRLGGVKMEVQPAQYRDLARAEMKRRVASISTGRLKAEYNALCDAETRHAISKGGTVLREIAGQRVEVTKENAKTLRGVLLADLKARGNKKDNIKAFKNNLTEAGEAKDEELEWALCDAISGQLSVKELDSLLNGKTVKGRGWKIEAGSRLAKKLVYTKVALKQGLSLEKVMEFTKESEILDKVMREGAEPLGAAAEVYAAGKMMEKAQEKLDAGIKSGKFKKGEVLCDGEGKLTDAGKEVLTEAIKEGNVEFMANVFGADSKGGMIETLALRMAKAWEKGIGEKVMGKEQSFKEAYSELKNAPKGTDMGKMRESVERITQRAEEFFDMGVADPAKFDAKRKEITGMTDRVEQAAEALAFSLAGMKLTLMKEAGLDVQQAKKMGLDMQQFMMVTLLARGRMVGMDVGSGKTWAIAVFMGMNKLILGENFRADIIDPSSARIQYLGVGEGKQYTEFFKKMGLETYDAVEAHAKKDIAGIINALNSSSKIVILDPTTITHLKNMWSEHRDLKHAMLRARVKMVDEFHEPMQSKMSAIIAGMTHDFDGTVTGREKQMYERGRDVFKAVSGIKIAADRKAAENLNLEGKAARFKNERGQWDLNDAALEKLGKALSKYEGMREFEFKDGKLKRSGVVHSVLNGMRMWEVKLEGGEKQQVDTGLDDAYHPIDVQSGKLQKDSTFNDVYMQLGMAFAEAKRSGITGEAALHKHLATRIKVSQTTMSTSLSLSMTNMFSRVCGASGTISGLVSLTGAKLGAKHTNLSAITIEDAIRGKIKAEDVNTFNMAEATPEKVAERAIEAANAGEAVFIADPLLSPATIRIIREKLEKAGITVKEIGSTTTNATEIAESLRGGLKDGEKGEVLIGNTAAFTGLDFCGGVYKDFKKAGKTLRQKMFILNAESIPADRLGQLLGRFTRHGAVEKASFEFGINHDRLAKMEKDMSHGTVRKHLLQDGIIGGKGTLRNKQSRVQRALGDFDGHVRKNESVAEKMSITDRLVLNATYQQRIEISEALTFSIRDSLRNDMVIGFLKSFLELPGITDGEKKTIQAELDYVLQTDVGMVEFGRAFDARKGLGETVVAESVNGCLMDAYKTLGRLEGAIESQQGMKMMANQKALLGDLGTVRKDRITGELKAEIKDWDKIGESTGSFMDKVVSGSYREMVGVLKALAKEVMPSESIGRSAEAGEATSIRVERAEGIGESGKAELQGRTAGEVSIKNLKPEGILAKARNISLVTGLGGVCLLVEDDEGNVERLAISVDDVSKLPAVLREAIETEGTQFTGQLERRKDGYINVHFSQPEIMDDTKVGAAMGGLVAGAHGIDEMQAGLRGLMPTGKEEFALTADMTVAEAAERMGAATGVATTADDFIKKMGAVASGLNAMDILTTSTIRGAKLKLEPEQKAALRAIRGAGFNVMAGMFRGLGLTGESARFAADLTAAVIDGRIDAGRLEQLGAALDRVRDLDVSPAEKSGLAMLAMAEVLPGAGIATSPAVERDLDTLAARGLTFESAMDFVEESIKASEAPMSYRAVVERPASLMANFVPEEKAEAKDFAEAMNRLGLVSEAVHNAVQFWINTGRQGSVEGSAALKPLLSMAQVMDKRIAETPDQPLKVSEMSHIARSVMAVIRGIKPSDVNDVDVNAMVNNMLSVLGAGSIGQIEGAKSSAGENFGALPVSQAAGFVAARAELPSDASKVSAQRLAAVAQKHGLVGAGRQATPAFGLLCASMGVDVSRAAAQIGDKDIPMGVKRDFISPEARAKVDSMRQEVQRKYQDISKQKDEKKITPEQFDQQRAQLEQQWQWIPLVERQGVEAEFNKLDKATKDKARVAAALQNIGDRVMKLVDGLAGHAPVSLDKMTASDAITMAAAGSRAGLAGFVANTDTAAGTPAGALAAKVGATGPVDALAAKVGDITKVSVEEVAASARAVAFLSDPFSSNLEDKAGQIMADMAGRSGMWAVVNQKTRDKAIAIMEHAMSMGTGAVGRNPAVREDLAAFHEASARDYREQFEAAPSAEAMDKAVSHLEKIGSMGEVPPALIDAVSSEAEQCAAHLGSQIQKAATPEAAAQYEGMRNRLAVAVSGMKNVAGIKKAAMFQAMGLLTPAEAVQAQHLSAAGAELFKDIPAGATQQEIRAALAANAASHMIKTGSPATQDMAGFVMGLVNPGLNKLSAQVQQQLLADVLGTLDKAAVTASALKSATVAAIVTSLSGFLTTTFVRGIMKELGSGIPEVIDKLESESAGMDARQSEAEAELGIRNKALKDLQGRLDAAKAILLALPVTGAEEQMMKATVDVTNLVQSVRAAENAVKEAEKAVGSARINAANARKAVAGIKGALTDKDVREAIADAAGSVKADQASLDKMITAKLLEKNIADKDVLPILTGVFADMLAPGLSQRLQDAIPEESRMDKDAAKQQALFEFAGMVKARAADIMKSGDPAKVLEDIENIALAKVISNFAQDEADRKAGFDAMASAAFGEKVPADIAAMPDWVKSEILDKAAGELAEKGVTSAEGLTPIFITWCRRVNDEAVQSRANKINKVKALASRGVGLAGRAASYAGGLAGLLGVAGKFGLVTIGALGTAPLMAVGVIAAITVMAQKQWQKIEKEGQAANTRYAIEKGEIGPFIGALYRFADWADATGKKFSNWQKKMEGNVAKPLGDDAKKLLRAETRKAAEAKAAKFKLAEQELEAKKLAVEAEKQKLRGIDQTWQQAAAVVAKLEQAEKTAIDILKQAHELGDEAVRDAEAKLASVLASEKVRPTPATAQAKKDAIVVLADARKFRTEAVQNAEANLKSIRSDLGTAQANLRKAKAEHYAGKLKVDGLEAAIRKAEAELSEKPEPVEALAFERCDGISRLGDRFTHPEMNDNIRKLFGRFRAVFKEADLKGLIVRDAAGNPVYDSKRDPVYDLDGLGELLNAATAGQKAILSDIEIVKVGGKHVVIASGVPSHCGRRTGVVWISRKDLDETENKLIGQGIDKKDAGRIAKEAIVLHEKAERDELLKQVMDELGKEVSPEEAVDWLEDKEELTDGQFDDMLRNAHGAAVKAEANYINRHVITGHVVSTLSTVGVVPAAQDFINAEVEAYETLNELAKFVKTVKTKIGAKKVRVDAEFIKALPEDLQDRVKDLFMEQEALYMDVGGKFAPELFSRDLVDMYVARKVGFRMVPKEGGIDKPLFTTDEIRSKYDADTDALKVTVMNGASAAIRRKQLILKDDVKQQMEQQLMEGNVDMLAKVLVQGTKYAACGFKFDAGSKKAVDDAVNHLSIAQLNKLRQAVDRNVLAFAGISRGVAAREARIEAKKLDLERHLPGLIKEAVEKALPAVPVLPPTGTEMLAPEIITATGMPPELVEDIFATLTSPEVRQALKDGKINLGDLERAIREKATSMDIMKELAKLFKQAGVLHGKLVNFTDVRGGAFKAKEIDPKNNFKNFGPESPIRLFMLVDDTTEHLVDPSVKKYAIHERDVAVRDENRNIVLDKEGRPQISIDLLFAKAQEIAEKEGDKGILDPSQASYAFAADKGGSIVDTISANAEGKDSGQRSSFLLADPKKIGSEGAAGQMAPAAISITLARLSQKKQATTVVAGCEGEEWDNFTEKLDKLKDLFNVIRIKAENIGERIKEFVDSIARTAVAL
ncbi:MAG: hypothetical protein ABH825_00560 [Candidatus Omnitrophota bacterium]